MRHIHCYACVSVSRYSQRRELRNIGMYVDTCIQTYTCIHIYMYREGCNFGLSQKTETSAQISFSNKVNGRQHFKEQDIHLLVTLKSHYGDEVLCL